MRGFADLPEAREELLIAAPPADLTISVRVNKEDHASLQALLKTITIPGAGNKGQVSALFRGLTRIVLDQWTP